MARSCAAHAINPENCWLKPITSFSRLSDSHFFLSHSNCHVKDSLLVKWQRSLEIWSFHHRLTFPPNERNQVTG